jgi:hypothetical protein
MINFLTLARKLNFLTSNEVSTAHISNRYGKKVNSHYGKNHLPVFDGRALALDETAEVKEEDVRNKSTKLM